MARFITFGFLALPLIEIALFILVGRSIGLLPTLALVIAAAVVGALVLRQQGMGVVARIRNSVNAGAIPGRDMFDAMLIGMAGLFLLLPGFLSDVVGLTLLVPALRKAIFSALAGRVRVVETTTTYRHAPDQGPTGISGPSDIELNDDDWRNGR